MIPILTQVHDEMRRLAIAGSVVAGDDFRLKKLVAPLEQAGAKAPVFARVAEAVKRVVNATERESAEALLELTTLVSAILYTQGETGVDGTLQPIASVELGSTTTQMGARLLKPLLEALTKTGPGRLEVIASACERGDFRDLRLVRPALQAIDDSYAEIGQLVADKVLPAYGPSILGELRGKFDPKGRGGDARRLRLMHQLDPAGNRALVKQALEVGSKEVKVAAIACLGGEPEDLPYLLEQTKARAAEVRQAAYQALAIVDDDGAVKVLEDALHGKDGDVDVAARALRLSGSQNQRLMRALIAAAELELEAALATKDKEEAGKRLGRLQMLLGGLDGRTDEATEAFLLTLFEQRGAVAKIKVNPNALSGQLLNSQVYGLMERGSPQLRRALASAHASLPLDMLHVCFRAACSSLSPSELFDAFAPYVTDEKKGHRFVRDLGAGRYWSPMPADASFDPRWLDLAVQQKDLSLIRRFARPGHAGADAFLSAAFASALPQSKSLRECDEIVWTMAAVRHVGTSDAFIAALEKHGTTPGPEARIMASIIPHLPREALPRLEALVPKLDDWLAGTLVEFMEQWRNKVPS